MESSDKVTDSIDCCIGSIVWVRRRNGSWWPGKILGPDELSASNITSPRSRTPVKLLGREDASVDWYNLEKSKRVKAFRCGEFEDCIQRVEASLGLPPKKREKYARREDAILHALELEKELMEKKHVRMGYFCNEERDSIVPLETLGSGKGENPLAHESPRCLLPVPEEQSTREAASSSVEDTETDTAGTDEDTARLSDDNIVTVLEPKSLRSSELQWKHGSTSDDENDDFASGGGDTYILCATPIPMAVSKWKLKGKRNSRGIGKRSIHHIRDNNNILSNSKSPISETNFTGREGFGPDERNHMSQSSVLNNKRQSLTARSILIDTEYVDHDTVDWEELSWNHHERGLLLDVDVKVQASYQRRQDVPMISLISKLNGHAIVGHPIPVESIENGNFLVNNEKSVPRTAKRTRPDEVADFKGKHKKSGGGGYKATVAKKKKNKKKKKRISLLSSSSSSSSQKIKTLSSIGRYNIESYKEEEEEDEEEEELLERVMKGETKTGLTAVACIPIKLVFSRLHEKLVSRHH